MDSNGPTVVPQAHGGALRPFKKGQSGNPFGPPKKLVSTMLADMKAAGYERVNAGMIVEAIENLIGTSDEQLRKLANDKTQPVAVSIIAKGLLSKKGFDALQAMLDRAHGKAKQQVDLAASVTIPPTLNFLLHPVEKDAG